MDVNNKISETGLPKQPLNSPEDLKKATRKEIINIFDEDNNGIITQKEQKNVISRYLPKEYQNYDESIIEQSMKTWIYKDLNINAEEDQLGIDALKGKINVIKDDIVHNSSSSKQKQVFGLAEEVDTNGDGTTSKKEIVDKIHKLINTKEYKNLNKDEIEAIISDAVLRSYPTEEFTDNLLRIFTNHARDNLKRANEDPSMKETMINNAGKTMEERMANLEKQKQEVKESTSELLKHYERMVMFLLLSPAPDLEEVETTRETLELLKDSDLNPEQKAEYDRLTKMFLSRFPNP